MSILATFKEEVNLRDASPEIILAVQKQLVRLGYPLNVDGFFGPKTGAAFNQFKEDNFLGSPGLLGSSSAKALLKLLPTPKTKNDHINLILVECSKQGITLDKQQAYVLATVQHETDSTYQPIDEYGGAHTRYAPFFGRGYVQLTWLDNYRKYSKLTGKNLVQFPELAKDPFTAAFILVHGFKTGGFTGKSIGQYISNSHCDFINARRCINWIDKAELIAGHAQQWMGKLKQFV